MYLVIFSSYQTEVSFKEVAYGTPMSSVINTPIDTGGLRSTDLATELSLSLNTEA